MGEKYKWKMGAQLSEIEREEVVRVLEETRGEPMEIEVDSGYRYAEFHPCPLCECC